MSEQNSKQLEVLVIDDDSSIRYILVQMINGLGAKATESEDGQKGLDEYKRRYDEGNPYDIVFTDLSMSHISGAGVTKEIKKVSPQTPVIVITGYEANVEYNKLLDELAELAPDGFLQKPFSLESIKSTLEKYKQNPATLTE